MTVPVNDASRATVIKIDAITMEIRRIWMETNSEYFSAKKLLHDADLVLYTDSKKAYKLLVKAKKTMVRESEVAYDYNKVRDAVIQCDDPKVKDLNRKYIDALRKEDFSGAKKVLEKLQKSSCASLAVPGLEIKLVSSDSGKAVYDLRNSTDHDITVKSMVFNAGSERLPCDTGYPFLVRKCSSQKITVDFAAGSEEVSGHLEYEDGGITKQINTVTGLTSECGDGDE